MAGECVVGLARRRGPGPPLPAGLHRAPGPCLVVAARYTDSPVDTYLELAVGEPARLGARPGLCITTMVVDSPDSRIGGRLNWGFPKELGTLRWEVDGADRQLTWQERGVVVRARPKGPAFPALVPVRALQRRADGAVVVPGRFGGRARLGRLEVEAPDGDALASLAGRHPGAVVSGMRFVVDPARLPVGVRATLRAPLRAVEPALLSPPSGD